VATKQFSLDLLFEAETHDYFHYPPGKFDIQVTRSKLLMAAGTEVSRFFSDNPWSGI
jgi:hypothetical protein